MIKPKTPKNAFKIAEVMQLYGIKSRMTFARRRKAHLVPEPNLGTMYSREHLEKHTAGITQGA